MLRRQKPILSQSTAPFACTPSSKIPRKRGKNKEFQRILQKKQAKKTKNDEQKSQGSFGCKTMILARHLEFSHSQKVLSKTQVDVAIQLSNAAWSLVVSSSKLPVQKNLDSASPRSSIWHIQGGGGGLSGNGVCCSLAPASTCVQTTRCSAIKYDREVGGFIKVRQGQQT